MIDKNGKVLAKVKCPLVASSLTDRLEAWKSVCDVHITDGKQACVEKKWSKGLFPSVANWDVLHRDYTWKVFVCGQRMLMCYLT